MQLNKKYSLQDKASGAKETLALKLDEAMQSEAAGQTYAALDSARNFVAEKVDKV
jgi:hypothetical protein